MLVLRVPCDARMSWRGVNSLRSNRHTRETPAHPALLGKPERDFKTKTKIKSKIEGNIVGPNSFGQDLCE